MIDFEYMAMLLADLSGIPVRVYCNEKFIKLFHINKFKPDLAILEEENIFRNPASVSYYMTDSFLFFGLFRVKSEPISFMLGPVTQIPLDNRAAREILLSMGESPSRSVELLNYLRAIPNYPLRNFLQILCTFAYFINDEKIEISSLLTNELDAEAMSRMRKPAISNVSEGNVANHNTFELEQELMSNIEHGRPDELQKMFRIAPVGRAGKMAQDTLRQQKNLLIVTATLASRAAIRGGMDTETAFILSDLFIQKAELMSSYESLVRLSMQMTIEFAERVAALQCGESGRKLIRDARLYILQHIDERITTEQLAEHLSRNRTYLCSVFKAETGMSVNAYITQMKIDEAKRLLEVTDKSLKSIAEHLGFSTQNYFQNVFKKVAGMTPMEYRSQHSM